MTSFLKKESATVKAKLLDAGIVFGKNPLVREVYYDLEKLVITIDSDNSGQILQVVFDNVRGFRCLDEGDLLDFWDNEFMTDNWLFEILSGGWLDQEDKREGFLSKTLEFREFLICGVHDCVSVITNTPPIFEIENIALNSKG
jgi:hypothetical protein